MAENPNGSPIVVVGAGPAGLAVALGARQRGLEVLVLDRRHPPLDKPCGEGLMPDAVARLDELGVRLDPRATAPFRGIRYLDGEVVADGLFPHGGGLGVRRLELHRALVARCHELAVEIRWGQRVTGVRRLESRRGAPPRAVVETAEEEIPARWVVAADGLRSPLRRQAGLQAPELRRTKEHRRFGLRRHYHLAPWSDRVEVYWADGCEAYVTPVAAGEVGVAMLWGGDGRGFDQLLEHFPALAERLEGAVPASRDLGCGPLHQRVRRVTRGPLALVGDASGYLDAITGEGLALAFHQAAALVDALAAGNLRPYARAHRRIGRLPNTLTAVLLAIERRPRLRRRVIRTLAADPALFSRLLGIHARTLKPTQLGFDGAWRLVRGLAGA
ncbi:MAG: NAD(P)/FAD-dependent oxidoreductase [Acidobacteriota bacterium]|nr:NAD(P)/FAD-dependent oxidoreductase [Acidobacteriota bacterium]